MPGVELRTSAREGHVVVFLRGELDVSGTASVEAAIATVVVPGQSLIIDMSALDFFDCASLCALLRVQELARSFGGDVVLAAPPRRARRLLVLSGRDQAFRVHPSVEAAVVSIGSRAASDISVRCSAETKSLKCTERVAGSHRIA